MQNRRYLTRFHYMIDISTLGKRLYFFRIRVGLTQKQLAVNLGVTPQAVSKWERGLSCPDILILDELAGIFNVSIGEVLGIKD